MKEPIEELEAWLLLQVERLNRWQKKHQNPWDLCELKAYTKALNRLREFRAETRNEQPTEKRL